MAYSAFPKSAEEMMPASARAGASPTRHEPISQTAPRRIAGAAHAPETSATAASALLRFLVLLVVISGLTCLYVWQANSISAIGGETQAMAAEVQTLERQNVRLMLEYSRWDTPGYIEAESSKSGMVVGPAPVRVQLPGLSQRQAASSDAETSAPIRLLAAWLPSSPTFGPQAK